MAYIERRKFDRAVFKLDDGVKGFFTMAKVSEQPVIGYILNLSMGGLYFTPSTGYTEAVKQHDNLTLLQIKALPTLEFLTNIDLRVKYVFNPGMLERIGIGCEFINVPDSSRRQIGDFVYKWREKSSLYIKAAKEDSKTDNRSEDEPG